MSTFQKTFPLFLSCLFAFFFAGVVRAGDDASRREASYTWSTEVAFPDLGNDATNHTVREWVEERVKTMVGDASGLIATDPEYHTGEWNLGMDYEVFSPSEGVRSILFTTVTYPSGAAHPGTTVDAVNINLDSGKLLTLPDLFGDPQKALSIMAKSVRELIEATIRQEHPEMFGNGGDGPIWFTEGLQPKADNYDCLVLEPEGIRVYFQQYQVLPYVFGTPNALIPLSLLEEAAPNRSVWPNP